MKIGIITHHYVNNYGAYLQAYALQNKIKEIDPSAKVEFINLIIKKHYLLNLYRRLKFSSINSSIKSYIEGIKQFKTLAKYEKTLPISRKFTVEMINSEYDKIIIGSDEVWNYKDYAYTPIKFGYNLNNVNTYTYAASCGEVLPEDEIPDDVIKGMKNLKKIAVRDYNTRDLVTRAINKNATYVLDPTLIYNYDNELKNITNIMGNKKYILIYGCKFTNLQKEILISYAKRNNLKIIGAGEYMEWYDEMIVDINPFQWVKLFQEANIILTGTFHGLMFSIKFYKNFICLPVFQNRINKTKTILEDFNLIDRLIIDKDDINKFESLLENKSNYDGVKNILNKRIEMSEKYILEVLKD